MRNLLIGFMVGVLLSAGVAYLISANTTSGSVNTEALEGKELQVLHVELIDGKGQKIGSAMLREGTKGVLIQVEAQGLTPGKHGFHIHEQTFKDADFAQAGGHFNPTKKEHGRLNPKGYHLGDLGNLTVGQDGTVQAEIFAGGVTLKKGDPHSILGRSLIIHSEEDDELTDPAGNAGDRIAGGNIAMN